MREMLSLIPFAIKLPALAESRSNPSLPGVEQRAVTEN